MKRMKKIVGLLLALVMVLGMTTTAFAANITINKGANGSKYTAYMLFTAEALEDESGTYNYVMNFKYADVLKEATEKNTEEEILDYIDVIEDDTTEANVLAGDIYAAIKNAGLTGEQETETDVFTNVAAGYYLIAETQKANEADTYSLIMLRTVGEDITIDTKEDVPTVGKQVKEVNDSAGTSDWGNFADHDVNDMVEYQIKGTVSSKYADYKSYYYSFSDTMDDSLTLTQGSVEVYVGGTVVNKEYQKDGKRVTDQFDIDYEGHAFTAQANLKELTGVTITGTSEIWVTYTATLNEKALHGKPGNENAVFLEYENDPYHEGDGNPETPDRPGDPENPDDPDGPGKTPIVKNIVFTFKAKVNKVNDKNEPLTGAGFTLFKYDDATEEYMAVGEEISGGTEFAFAGLDVGKYKLEETTVPEGYNKAADIIFNVVAEYNTDVDPAQLTELKVMNEDKTAELDDFSIITETSESGIAEEIGTFVTTVENKPGVILPSTGGMGTTIFYVLGAILVIGSAVVLITRKRMSAK